MLTDLLRRKTRVTDTVAELKGQVNTLTRAREDARQRLAKLRVERESAHQRFYDDKARLLIVEGDEERRRLDAEVTALEAQLPAMDKELAELEGEILPRLAREQAAAERAVQLEVFRANSTTAETMAQVPHTLQTRWNKGTEELVAVLEELAASNGRCEWWTSTLSNAARALKVDAPRLPAALPLGDLLQTLQAALREAWRDGQERGEEAAGKVYLGEPRVD